MKLEWLMLADSAQVINNKLYLLGGGWDRVFVNSAFPASQPLGLAVAISVDWVETNQKHMLHLEVLRESDNEQPQSLMAIDAEFEIGRAPGLRPGASQRTQLAINGTIQLVEPAVHTVVAMLDGEEAGRINFEVVPGPLLQPNRRG